MTTRLASDTLSRDRATTVGRSSLIDWYSKSFSGLFGISLVAGGVGGVGS